MTHDVFISYSHTDKLVADGICGNLEAEGIRCWIAPRDIQPGEDWPKAIAGAISQCCVMVLVFSASSNSSEEVSRELILAADSKLIIIPFKIENIEPEPGKKYYLARTHWLDAINPPTQSQINSLVGCVRALLPVKGVAPSPTPPKVQPVVDPKNSTPPFPEPAPRKKSLWRRALWLLIPLVVLALAGCLVVLALVTHTIPMPFLFDPTGTPTATGSPPPVWDVNLSDDFTSNIHRWSTYENVDDGCSINSLNVQDGILLWSLQAFPENICGYIQNPDMQAVTDFEVSLDVQRISGSGEAAFGIGFRILDENNFYSFVISDTAQRFEIRRLLNNSWKTLEDWKTDPVIQPTGSNHLAISASDNVFYFYINDRLVDTIEDAGISSGYIGVVSEVFDEKNISISYDNFVVNGRR